MTILCPFWNLLNFDRYVPQMKAISDHVRAFTIVHMYGTPKEGWRFNFRMIEPPSGVGGKTIKWYFGCGKIAQQLKHFRPDLIYALSGFMWVGRIAKNKQLNIPYVIRLRGNFLKERTVSYGWFKRRIFNWIDKTNLRDASLIIPISSKLKQLPLDLGVNRDHVTEPVPIGVDTNMFKPMKMERYNDFTVAYAGRISPEKRVSHLLRIAERQPNIRFILAGRPQMSLSFPSNVEYLGEIPFSKMPIFYNKADLVVLPSLTEGFPCTILEAYACGKPVLVAKEAFPEELKLFGSVVDISHFESEINSLKNADLKIVGRQARSYVKEYYTWGNFGQATSNYLKGLIE